MVLTHANAWQSIGKPHSCTVHKKPILHKTTVLMCKKKSHAYREKCSDPIQFCFQKGVLWVYLRKYCSSIRTVSDQNSIRSEQYQISTVSDQYSIRSVQYQIRTVSDQYSIRSEQYQIRTVSN